MAEETQEIQVQETEKQEIVENDAERTRARPAFVPRTDIYESDDEIVLITDMPGVDEDTVDITVEKNILTVNGLVEATEPEGYTLSYAEYRVGDYQRSFKLSNEIDQEKIDATIKDGVLRLTLPKVGPTTRKIAVKAS
jgi:HSP20 family molecular chaperone IbpA